jgi:8-oxo-dGTP pyrophosphatase MutT (NUDIX family)
MYKIYINDSDIILCDTEEKERLKTDLAPDLVVLYQGQQKTLLNYVDMLEKNRKRKTIIIHSSDPKKLKKDFKSLFVVIEAAGGVIYNELKEILFIFRRGSWDLPKGKIDKGETKKQAAIREVMEETGINGVKIVHKIGKTHHMYRDKGRRAIKKSHWYLMQTHKQPLKPQIAEDIAVAKWMTRDDFLKQDRKVYRSILNVLNRV